MFNLELNDFEECLGHLNVPNIQQAYLEKPEEKYNLKIRTGRQ